MNPRAVQTAGVMAGWLVFAATVIPIVLRGRSRSARRDAASLPAMLLQGVGFSLAFGRMREVVAAGASDTSHWGIAIVVSALALTSGAFGVAAVRRLGGQWSLVARVTDQHELITTGPYAVVRHPIYTAMLGLLIATGLTFATPLWTATGLLFSLIGTGLRTKSDERLRASALGGAYATYRRRVPALIPYAQIRR
jgi:protein-S-isoprenylcysteine O-methyltransferase Ste14